MVANPLFSSGFDPLYCTIFDPETTPKSSQTDPETTPKRLADLIIIGHHDLGPGTWLSGKIMKIC